MPNPNAGYQEELFRGFGHQTLPRGKRFPSGISLAQRSLSVSFEQMIFLGIAAIVILVLIFSLGVERGKNLMRSFSEATLVAPIATLPAQGDREQKVEESKPSVEKVKSAADVLPERSYTLQVASYRDKKAAEKSLSELRAKGYESFMMAKGDFSVICIGKYHSSEEASKFAKGFKKQYPDCFVRKW